MSQPSLFETRITDLGPTPEARLARRDDHETSRLAAAAASRRSPSQRSQVWQTLLKLGEATDYEIAEHLGILRTSAAKRRQELTDAGLVEDTGRTRPTDTGTSAVIWRPSSPSEF
jgi:transcription initiation factor IIE alpha subunit